MRVLLTNNTLSARAGSELYVRDIAIELMRRGHHPVAYSTQLGAVADELRGATVPVIGNLDSPGEPPDIIHGQHHYESLSAMLRFRMRRRFTTVMAGLPGRNRRFDSPEFYGMLLSISFAASASLQKAESPRTA